MIIKRFIKQNLPILILLFVVLILFAANYKANTFLTGWDNLHPEFDFGLNIKRSIFAVWQEYQGLGLLGGMGHAADIVHQIVLLVLSFFLPLSLLRYTWTFLMLFLGGVGAYKLICLLHNEKLDTCPLADELNADLKLSSNKEFILGNRRSLSEDEKFLEKNQKVAERHLQRAASGQQKLIPFIGAIFYLLNLSTIQTFYAPFEAFIAHFAALPWLLLAVLTYYQKPSKKNLLFLAIISFLATPQAYIPTLFVVYLISVSIPLITLGVYDKSKEAISKLTKIFLITFLINAFWLLPFLYFTFTNGHVAMNAKINQMGTPTIYAQNKEFGNIQDVALLKGFWFNNVDLNSHGIFSYMLSPWRNHLANPFVKAIGYLLFTVILMGVFFSIYSLYKDHKKANIYRLAFLVLFLFSFTMLAIGTPPFSWLDTLFRKIPLFHEAFRFAFTKFSILTSLVFAVFFAIGIDFIRQQAFNYNQRSPSTVKWLNSLLPGIFIILLIIFVFPAFEGHLLYNKERLKIPKQYFALFDFFKHQNPNTRIANFPQDTFWGWNFYRWGYGGSGFLWYGIQQPILDRAFDVWSRTDENYYWELSNALYSKNASLFYSVLNKYQINWLLVDGNIINPPSPKALFLSELKDIISHNPHIHKAFHAGNLDVYKVDLKDNPNHFIFTDKILPSSNEYRWGDLDKAYLDNGNYTSTKDNIDYFYPFRSLFSNKSQRQNDFSATQDANWISFSKKINGNTMLQIPSFAKSEYIIAASVRTEKDKNNNLSVTLQITTPKILIDNKLIWGGVINYPLFTIADNYSYPLTVNINGTPSLTIKNKNSFTATTFLTLNQNNIINLNNAKQDTIATQVIPSDIFQKLPILNKILFVLPNENKNSIITVKIPKIADNYAGFKTRPTIKTEIKNCDNFRRGQIIKSTDTVNGQNWLKLYSKNATACTGFYYPSLSHKEGYIIFINALNIKGRTLHFWIQNQDENFSPIDTYLSSNTAKNVYILPNQDLYGQAYSLHFDNISIGQGQTINDLGSISMYPIPYNFLTSIFLQKNTTIHNNNLPIQSINVSHPNESLYIINQKDEGMKQSGSETLILSQSFDPGWKAYEIQNSKFKIQNSLEIAFPFLFGTELRDHTLVNNWENGWGLSNLTMKQFNNETIVVIFWPQYLEYLGFVLLAAALAAVWWLIDSKKL